MGVSSPGDRLDEVALAVGLEDADRDGDIHLTTDSDGEVGIEAAAVPNCELSSRPSVAYPPHHLAVSGRRCAPVGPVLSQPGDQRIAGSGGNR